MRNAYFTLFAMLCLSVTAWAENWMKPLPDETYVAVLSIPGSHDTATGNGMSLPEWGQTQDIDMATQWSIGIRAFDLRPKVNDDHLQVNHGVLSTNLRFDDALYLLRDSLVKNPSEFAVVHLLYASDYDKEKDTYKTMLLELLGRDDLKDFLVDFRADLTVGDMRGKILLLSRDQYDSKPVGGFFTNWCGWIDWNAQRNGKIVGPSSTATLYMQDLADTHETGKLQEKKDAIKKMLDFSTKHATPNKGSIVWVYNFASAYSKTGLFGISLADGYRDNAANTHATIIDYLNTHEAGPTGIILMDYVGVAESKGYATRGKEVVDLLIANNFKYIVPETDEEKAIKAKYEEIHDQLTALRTQSIRIRTQIKKECLDVSKPFLAEVEAIRTILNEKLADLEEKFKNGTLTADEDFDAESVENKLNSILQAAQEAQREYEKGTGVEAVLTAYPDMKYCIYSLTGERLKELKRGAVNILRFENGQVRKVWVNK